MAELTIEQKAERYDEAIKRAQSKIKNDKGHVLYEDDVLEIFPELAESKGVRIIKVIRGWIITRPALFFDNGISKEEILAWLDMQSEKEKFIEKELGRIREKASSVLQELEQQGEQNHVWSEEDELRIRELESLVKQVWAKAERGNDKEIIHKMSDLSFFLKTLKPQLNREWSEADERCANIVVSALSCPSLERLYNFNKVKSNDMISWLESIKYRVQPKQEWSEDDEKQLRDIIELLPNLSNRHTWLKSLKDRIQPKQEWSEEDEAGLGDALWAIQQARTIAKDENDMGNLWYAENWLKTIKDRYVWKPSAKQMNALDSTLQYSKVSSNSYEHLNSLFNDLKKLK